MGEPAALIESFRTVHAEQTEGRLRWARHRKPILLAIGIALFNQLSGIDAILYYLNDIFAAAGFSRVSADVQAVGIGVANLVATVLGMSLLDRVGSTQRQMVGDIGRGVCRGQGGT